MSHDLSSRDIERGKFAFSIYDFDGNETMDAFYLGDCLRALNLNPTNATVDKMGGTKLKKQKYFKVEEFLPIFAEVKNGKDEGGNEDFMECLRLYDKHDDGKMLFAELQHILLAVGEQLTDAEVAACLKECCEEEDEDGFIKYAPFVKKLMAGPDAGN
jgi:Ca2+-binding EF-hand superfamily protein